MSTQQGAAFDHDSTTRGDEVKQTELPGVPEAYDWEAMRANGHKVIDFIVDYHKALKDREFPCQSLVKPNYLQEALGEPHAPEHAVSFDSVLDDVKRSITPGMTHWQHPDFLSFFPAMLSPPALLGDLIASAFNQPGFNWVASPAATELEVIVTNWLADAFGFPKDLSWNGTGGCVLQPSATESAIVVMLAAKNKALSTITDEADKLAALGKLVAYVSDQAHFCIEKASRVLSIPHFRKIATSRDEKDGNFAIDPVNLRAAIEEDLSNGLIPFFVSVNYGATGICAIDPIREIATVTREHHLWLNVDAAYAGVTCVCDELRAPFAAASSEADSILINGSKWFSMMFNSSFMFFRDKAFIVSSLNATGVYLSNSHTENNLVVDFKDYHLGLGRPFRALKVYSTLKCFGLTGLRSIIRRHIQLAKYLHYRLAEDKRLALPIETRFGLVCFTLARGKQGDTSADQNTKALELLKYINEVGKLFLVHTVLNGEIVLRISLAYPSLTFDDMDRIVQIVQQGLNHLFQ